MSDSDAAPGLFAACFVIVQLWRIASGVTRIADATERLAALAARGRDA